MARAWEHCHRNLPSFSGSRFKGGSRYNYGMFDPSTMSGAFSSVKVIFDLLKNARDAQLAMKISSEVANIQSRLVDVQQQALALQTENQELKSKIQAFNDDKAFRDSLEYDPTGIYKRHGRDGLELYCSACLDRDNKRVRLQGGFPGTGTPSCQIHGYRD